MSVALALFQPEIPQNTGTLLRLSACLGFRLHVIHPTAFAFSEKSLRRAGLDYIDKALLTEHASFSAFDAWRRAEEKRLVLLTTRARQSAYSVSYGPNDILLVGRESAGVTQAAADAADLAIRIPMREGLRSINMALSATMIVSEALRQTSAFESLT